MISAAHVARSWSVCSGPRPPSDSLRGYLELSSFVADAREGFLDFCFSQRPSSSVSIGAPPAAGAAAAAAAAAAGAAAAAAVGAGAGAGAGATGLEAAVARAWPFFGGGARACGAGGSTCGAGAFSPFSWMLGSGSSARGGRMSGQLTLFPSVLKLFPSFSPGRSLGSSITLQNFIVEPASVKPAAFLSFSLK